MWVEQLNEPCGRTLFDSCRRYDACPKQLGCSTCLWCLPFFHSPPTYHSHTLTPLTPLASLFHTTLLNTRAHTRTLSLFLSFFLSCFLSFFLFFLSFCVSLSLSPSPLCLSLPLSLPSSLSSLFAALKLTHASLPRSSSDEGGECWLKKCCKSYEKRVRDTYKEFCPEPGMQDENEKKAKKKQEFGKRV